MHASSRLVPAWDGDADGDWPVAMAQRAAGSGGKEVEENRRKVWIHQIRRGTGAWKKRDQGATGNRILDEAANGGSGRPPSRIALA